MEKVKLWFIMHDGKNAVCAYPNMDELMAFQKLKYLESDVGDKGYVFMLGTPESAKLVNDPTLDEDPTLDKSFSVLTINKVAVLFTHDEDLLTSKAIDWDYTTNELKKLYGDFDMEQVILSLLPKPQIIKTLANYQTEGGLYLE